MSFDVNFMAVMNKRMSLSPLECDLLIQFLVNESLFLVNCGNIVIDDVSEEWCSDND